MNRIVERGIFANVLRLEREKGDPNGEYIHVVEVKHSSIGNIIRVPCTDFTGAMVLMDVFNRVLPAPVPSLMETDNVSN